MPSTYGGEINTPTLDRIAKEGISYNRFHTTAMCSPTRAALLTGRNHHRVGHGQIAELANDWDGYSGVIPKSQRDHRRGAERLRLQHGRLRQMAQYAREANHCTGPFDHWPTGYGFEYFYGFLAGEASQYEPTSCATRPWFEPNTSGKISPDRGHGRRRDRLAAQAEGLSARQAVLHVLGARRRRTARTTS